MFTDILLQLPAEFGLLLIVLLVDRFLPVSPAYHPLSLFKHVAMVVGKKVNNPDKHSIAHQRFAGKLAIPILLTPIITIVYALIFFAEYPLLIEAVLLWLSLSWASTRSAIKKTQRALLKNQKSLAKETLKRLVLRDTKTLSQMGICKAGIEATLLRAQKELFVVMFFYLIGGGIAAFSCRLLIEMQQVWNAKLYRYRYFGQAIARLTQWLNWFPTRLFAFTLALTGRFSQSIKNLKSIHSQWPNKNAAWVIAAGAAAINTQLGGPLIYDNEKHRRTRILCGVEPTPSMLGEAIKLVEINLIIWLLGALLIQLLVIAYHTVS
ncbi:cobalamin biosynthesis protein CobD/CbiB [Flocculibacter collagenilyticus]|uniref:cobalamin biosynthesis protein CobD/CbiB n=1 Tax=Flocculibacter collagenilyticus TaxID=2744479 RepID=UPI0018F44DB9|nr:cobalamin biosynthesis protein [Flocculibacter collagenilyticus]